MSIIWISYATFFFKKAFQPNVGIVQIGWINNTRYKWAEWTGKEIKFKPATFYLGVTDYLAKAVEGQTREDPQQNHTAACQNSSHASYASGNSTQIAHAANAIEDHALQGRKDVSDPDIESRSKTERNLPEDEPTSKGPESERTHASGFPKAKSQSDSDRPGALSTSGDSNSHDSANSTARDSSPQVKPDLPGVVIKENLGSRV
jgi:Mg-chelatase subunit ChlI